MEQICEVIIDQAGKLKLSDANLIKADLQLSPDDLPEEEATTIELIEEDGHLFVSGGEPLDWSVADLVRQDREQRMKHLMGEYYQPPSEDEYGD